MNFKQFLTEIAGKKYKAQIKLDRWAWDVKFDVKDPSREAIADALKKAAAKFKETVDAHPTGLRFESYDEAVEFMNSMEYPGWPIFIEKASGAGGKSIKKVVHIDYKDDEPGDFQLEKLENGRYLVSTRAKSGPAHVTFLHGFMKLKAKKWAKDGRKEIDFTWRGNAFQTDAKEAAIQQAFNSAKNSKKSADAEKARKATPEYKKQKAKDDYASRKSRKIGEAKHAVFKKKIQQSLTDLLKSFETDIRIRNETYMGLDESVSFEIYVTPEQMHETPISSMVDNDNDAASARIKKLENARNASIRARNKEMEKDLEAYLEKVKQIPEFASVRKDPYTRRVGYIAVFKSDEVKAKHKKYEEEYPED